MQRHTIGYVAVLLVLVVSTRGPIESLCLLTWVAGGAAVLVTNALLRIDAHRRTLAHDASGLREVAGWRLVDSEHDPELLLALDLLIYLTEHARLTRRPIRGRRRRSRTSYALPLRELARAWGRDRGVSGRRADRLLASGLCARFGVVRRVPVGTTSAFHLTDTSTAGAIAHLERASGNRIIEWRLGRDPRWDAVDDACCEAARA